MSRTRGCGAGSRPGVICGATGAHAAVLTKPLLQYGLGVLPYIVIAAGLLTIVLGFLRVAQLVRMIPISAMQGFTNGLAIIIALGQLHAFRVSVFELNLGVPAYASCAVGDWMWCRSDAAATICLMLLWIVLTMAIVHFMPRLTKLVPSALVAIGVVIALEQFVRAVSDYSTPLTGEVTVTDAGAPRGFWAMDAPLAPFSAQLALDLILPVIFYTGVGVVELLLTMEVVREQVRKEKNPPPYTIHSNIVCYSRKHQTLIPTKK